MENNDRFVQIPNEDAVQVRLGIRRGIRLPPVTIAATAGRSWEQQEKQEKKIKQHGQLNFISFAIQ